MVSSQSDVQYREGYDSSDNYANGLHVSPDLAPLEASFEVRPGRARIRRVSPSGNRRPVGREVLRLIVYGLIIMTIGGAAFASQYGNDKIKEALGTLQRSVSGLSPALGANPSARRLEGVSKSSDQVSTQDKLPPKEARFIQSIPVSVAAASSAPIQQQPQTMASDLAIVEGPGEAALCLTEEDGTRHRGFGSCQTDLSQKVWWLYQSSGF